MSVRPGASSSSIALGVAKKTFSLAVGVICVCTCSLHNRHTATASVCCCVFACFHVSLPSSVWRLVRARRKFTGKCRGKYTGHMQLVFATILRARASCIGLILFLFHVNRSSFLASVGRKHQR